MGTSGCAGEVVGGLFGMLLRHFAQSVLIVLIALVVVYVVYFLINPKRALAQLRHRPRTCLECQALQQVARQAAVGRETCLYTGAFGRFFHRAERLQLTGELHIRWHRRVCTVSFHLDGVTHAASYDYSKEVPDGGGEVVNPPAA